MKWNVKVISYKIVEVFALVITYTPQAVGSHGISTVCHDRLCFSNVFLHTLHFIVSFLRSHLPPQ